MIMLISALAPMAVPVSATHNTSEPLVLEMQDDNGNWTGVPEFVDPITGNGDFLDPGTYEFRFTSNDLTLNDSYELDWEVEVCEFFDDDCDDAVSESRSWTAMGTTSTEPWNLTLGIMDCDVSIHAYLSNATSGDSFEYEWDLLGPCGNTGDITLELDLDDDGVDEVVQGFDFDEELSLSAGDYDASFNVSNLSSTGSYNMTWFVDLGYEYDEFVEGEAAWTGTDPGNALDFDLEIQMTTCDFMILAVLSDVSAGEDISAFVAMARGPCVQPIAVSIYDEESGEWIEMGGAMPEADYPDCFWSDEEVLWWCGEDTDGDGTLDYTDTWWYYCELSDYGWLCTDSFGQSEDHEFTENNTLLQPLFLEEGTYDVLVNLSALNATTHYAVHLGHLNPEYMEFNSTTENYSISAELPVSITDCDEWFQISVFDDPSNYPYEMPTFFTSLTYMGPCDEPPSRFNLTYDGMDYEVEYEYNTYDDCTDVGGGWECEWGHDYDGDGEADEYHYDFFPYEDCEYSEDDMLWYCEMLGMGPTLEEGNHSMELVALDLVVGDNYSVHVMIDVGTQQSHHGDEWIYDFEATAEEEVIDFYVETDNFTCHVDIRAVLSEDDGNQAYEVGMSWFSFNGPCEQPPSPFTLTYDGMDYEMDYHYSTYDDCTDVGDGWECEVAHDWDNDGEADDYHYDHFPYDHCEYSEDDMLWYCVTGEMHPEIEEGNHTMELTVEDLEVGTNYTVEMYIDICQNMAGCYGDWVELEFNATAETMSETFHLETDNYTCDVNINVHLYEDDYWGHSHVAYDNFHFRGPCEQPPSPFTLTYDGMDYEMGFETVTYQDCTDDGWGWECMDDDYGEAEYYPYDDCEFSEDDMVWYCVEMVDPYLDAGNHTMEITVEGLEPGMNYSMEINSYMWGMFSGTDDMTIQLDFTADSDVMSEEFVIEVMNSTCNVNINVQLYEDGDWGHSHVAHDYFNFEAPCEMEMDFPVDLGLEVDDGGWTTVDSMPMDLFFSDEDEMSDAEMIEMMLENVGYVMEEGNWSLRWTMDGLTNGSEYVLEVEIEVPSMEEDGEMTFFCGNGDEIPFYWVNDEYEDCEDGSDEQQYDEDGDPINWFDCMDGSEVWIYQVNDGNFDCPDGEDEYSESSGNGEEYFHYHTATDDHGHVEWNMEVTEDTCFMMINAAMSDMDEGSLVSMFIAMVMGPMATIDDNGNEIPDCIEMMINDGSDGDGPDWNMEDFAVGRDYEAVLEHVDFNESHVVLFVAQHTIMHDDFRMKIDHDFFNGDDYLNDTEAMEFEMMWVMNALPEGCDESAPEFAVSGFEVDCAEPMQMFHGLANDSEEEDIVWTAGWLLHYSNVTVDDNGELVIYYEGDDEDDEPEEFDGSICGSAGEFSGLLPVSWSYNGSAVESDCVTFEAGDRIGSIEIIFGLPDSDGDGYNDLDDRFPDDPEEWADTDDDGYGDNHDMFPDDPTEHWDSDGDGYGDNGDQYPWDASEWADSDGDGYGDNIDAFPNDSTEWVDTDADGTGDNADTDADGDGVDDSDEDSDGDGVNDDQDDFPFDANETTDSDGDGVGDNSDAFPDDANETTDTDNDGIGDNSDEDVDGDGVTNDLDDFPLDSGQSSDADGDGVGDAEDAFPNNANEYADSDGDGIGDNADDDDDNDGTPDTSDAFPTNPNENTDTDGDGYGDNSDAFPNDAGEWNDYDGDGVGDNSDAFMTDPYESRDTDGDGLGDNADAFPNDPNEKVDSDGDGVGNNADAFPTDPSETTDTDGDGVGDNADDDADGDGVPDEPVDPVDGSDSGGILPGFTALTGLASVLGAAILVAGRRKD